MQVQVNNNNMDQVPKPLIIFLFSVLMVLVETNASVNNSICITINLDEESHNYSYPEQVDLYVLRNICQQFNFMQHKEYCCLTLDKVLHVQHHFNSNLNISAILQQSVHTPNSTDGHLHIAKHNALSLSGNGSKENVILNGINLILSDIRETKMNNFTAEKSLLNVYGAKDPYSRSAITVENCIIINTRIILTDVILSIRDCEIKNCTDSAIVSYSSFILLAGVVKFLNNNGETGGALNLRGSRIRLLNNTNVTFRNNFASVFGGAVFVENADLYVSQEGYNSFCFYGIEEVNSNYSLTFDGNIAEKGGDHIYGASLKSLCTVAFKDCDDITNCSWASYEMWTRSNFKFHPALDATEALSTVSSKPTRVCLCNGNGQPQCTDFDSIFHEIQVYPGEHFTIPVVIVGGDFGTTIGVVYAHFDTVQECVESSDDGHTILEQVITQNKRCTNLTYCFYGSMNHTVNVYLSTRNLAKQAINFTTSRVESAIKKYFNDGIINQTLLYTPTLLNITFRPCPPGFILLVNLSRCGCYPQLDEIECMLKNGKGYISWNSSLWINHIYTKEDNGVITTDTCLFSYCKNIKKDIDLQYNPDAQCNFNRAGRVCGRCRNNYSLAIGSSECIYCTNHNSLALLIFFVAFGPLLVLVISALNLTVTQGTINGLLFYANVVWAYQGIFFPSDTKHVLIPLKLFIAWLNLDFGIKTCFYRGMDAFGKTWLQFIFPLYTATLFFIGLRFSSKLSKLFGSRSVPTLATLLVLSLTKLLRTIIAGLQLAKLTIYTPGAKSTTIVWALDGSLPYGKSPHVFLLLVVIVCLVFLWIPYTLILFSMQWLRKIDHYRPLKLIARYKPVYDAYFAPLKDKHHYWFGVLLLAQGLLLLISSLLLNVHPILSLLFLVIIVVLMLCYLNFMRVYKRDAITLLEGSFYINLILLTAGMLYLQEETNYATKQEKLLSLSIGIAFIKFCVIVIWNLIPLKLKKYCVKAEKGLQLFKMESADGFQDESDDYEEQYRRYRDSVLN